MSDNQPNAQLSIEALEEEIKAMKYDPLFDVDQVLSKERLKQEPVENSIDTEQFNSVDEPDQDGDSEIKNRRSKRASSSSFATGSSGNKNNKPSTGNTRRYGALVGQLQWYTNEEDLSRYIHECGIDEIGSIKFYENRANGQSLGFAGVLLGTEKDLNKLLSRLPKRLIYGMKPLCVVLNKENVSKFTNIAEEFLGIC
ncbi:hypothetical protein SNEBB_008606 [Seison nebaliae]|nr:hypothetical protein SNEBB_008606 [Seison nebaliae]